jgi:hypothetical protein
MTAQKTAADINCTNLSLHLRLVGSRCLLNGSDDRFKTSSFQWQKVLKRTMNCDATSVPCVRKPAKWMRHRRVTRWWKGSKEREKVSLMTAVLGSLQTQHTWKLRTRSISVSGTTKESLLIKLHIKWVQCDYLSKTSEGDFNLLFTFLLPRNLPRKSE